MELLKMKDEQLVNKIVKDFQKSEQLVEAKKEEWENEYRQYKSKLKELKEGRANLFIPYTWVTVEQLKARALQSFFTKEPYTSFAGVEESDVDGAKLMEDLVYYQEKDKIKLPFKFIQALENIFVYGNVIALYSWKVKEKVIKARQIVQDITMGVPIDEQEIEKTVKLYDDPDIEIIPIDDFFPDPEGYDIESCNYCCTRTYRDMKYLKAMEKQGKYNLPSDEELKAYTSETVGNFRDNINNLSSLSYDNDKEKTHEVISYYTDDEIIVVLDRKFVIRKEENPLYWREKPFIRGLVFPQEKQFYGDSMVRVISCLQDELNATRNQRIDNVSMILSKVFLKNANDDEIDDEMEEDGSLKLYPGRVINTKDIHNNLKALDIPDVTSSAYNEENIIKNDIQYVTAVNEVSRGSTPKRKETATTITTVEEASNTVFNYIIYVIEQSLLLPISDAIKKLNQQYITEDKLVRLYDKSASNWNYSAISPESIAGNYDVISVSPRFEAQKTKETRRTQLLELFNTFANNQLTQQYINIPEFMRKVMETYDIKDYKALIVEQPIQQSQPNLEDVISQLTPEEQEQFYNAPPEVQQQLLQSIMQQNINNGGM